MPIIPSPTYETNPRDDLIGEVMLMIDRAIEDGEEVSTWDLAEQILDMVKPIPVNPPAPVSSSMPSRSSALMAMVKDSREKYAP